MPGKVIPHPDDLTLELFQAIALTGQMHVQQCTDCGGYAHPPRYYCARCFSPRYRMAVVSGAGTVYSHTLSHYTTEPAWAGDVPYATVVVELDEGPRIVGAARHPDPDAIRIGQRVRVVPEPRTDDFSFLTVQFDGAPVPEGPVPEGPVPAATVPEGPVPEGPVPEGPVPEGPVPEGPVPEGPVPEGPVPAGTAAGDGEAAGA